MRKFIAQVFDFLHTVSLNMLVLYLICAAVISISMTVVGKLNYIYESYAVLRDADMENGIYLSGMNDTRALLYKRVENIKSIDGVSQVIDNINSYVGFSQEGSGTRDTIVLFTEDYMEHFPVDIASGRGLDYSSDELECIIAHDYYKNYKAGDYITVYVKDSSQDEPFEVSMKVVGTAVMPQQYLNMSGSGSQIETEEMINEVDFIITKDNDATREAFSRYLDARMNSPLAILTNVLVIPEKGLSAEQLSELQSKLMSYGMVAPVGEILDNTRAVMEGSLKAQLPLSLFLISFSVITLICLIVLSVYKCAADYAVWYTVGAGRKRILAVVSSAFGFTLLMSAVTARILIMLYYRIDMIEYEALYSTFYDVYINDRAIAVMWLFALAFIVVAFITTATAMRAGDPRSLSDKYKE